MYNNQKSLIKMIVIFAIVTFAFSPCTGTDADEADKKNTAENELVSKEDNVVGVTEPEEETELSEDKEEEIIPGNGTHFVEYNGKVWFLTPGDDSMETPALWGYYDNMLDGQTSKITTYNPKTKNLDYISEGAYYGKILVSGGRLILNGVDKNKNLCVFSLKEDGSDINQISGDHICGNTPNGDYFITEGYEDDSTHHFFICESDGSERLLESQYNIYQYVGIDEEYAFFMLAGEETGSFLAGYNLETGEEIIYGEIPAFEIVSHPGIPEELYVIDGKLYLHLASFDGTDNVYNESIFLSAICDKERSLEKIYPENDLRSEDYKVMFDGVLPTVAVVDGKFSFVEGVPGTVGVIEGTLGVYDDKGEFEAVTYGIEYYEIYLDEYSMSNEICEKIGNYIYLVRNKEERVPKEDVGWRLAYRRLETTFSRINEKTGEYEEILFLSNPQLMKAEEFLMTLPKVKEQMGMGMAMMRGGSQEINGTSMYIFYMGTDHEEQYVREFTYAVDSSNSVYLYDVITDDWELIYTK